MTARWRAGAIAMAWVAGLALAAAALGAAGHGALAPPPMLDPGRWPGWLAGRDPVVAAFSLVRLAGLAALWYVALAASVGAVLRLAGAVALVRIADHLTIGPVRRLLAGTLSLGLAASGLVGAAVPALASQTSTTSTSTTLLPPATITMHRLTPAESVGPPAAPATAAPVPQVVPAAAPATAAVAADGWTVRSGECFWSIAEQVLTNRSGRAATDAEIVPYWRRLIDANRLELAQRDNPDLIFPGQTFTVPTP
jgi:nucleoid-associated protein YgaU